MDNHLKCLTCLEFAIDAVESQCCNQIYCEQCSLEIYECETCRTDEIILKPNQLARRIIGCQQVDCQYQCGYQTPKSEMNNHLITCEQRPCSCNHCNFKGVIGQLSDHINEMHKVELIKMFDTNVSKIGQKKPPSVIDEQFWICINCNTRNPITSQYCTQIQCLKLNHDVKSKLQEDRKLTLGKKLKRIIKGEPIPREEKKEDCLIF